MKLSVFRKSAFKRPSCGFTLTELLVVIAILAALSALLFSVMKSAASARDSAVCVGNLRSLGVGMNMFLQENNGIYPKFYYPDSQWTSKLLPYISKKVYKCPNEPDYLDFDIDDIWVSYGYNYVHLAEDYGGNWNPPNPPRPVRLMNITRPESVILLVDSIMWWGAPGNSGRGYYLVEESPGWANPHARHNGLANVLWIDGHVTGVKWDVKETNIYKTLEARNWDWRLP